MRIDLKLALALSLGTLWHAGIARAFTTPAEADQAIDKSVTNVIGIRTVRPDLAPAAAANKSSFSSLKTLSAARVQGDVRSGAARIISGKMLASTALKATGTVDEYAALCLQYVDDHKDIFGVDAKDLVLRKNGAYVGKDVQFLKFDVKRDGLVIQDAHIDFRFKFGKLLQIENKTFSEAVADQGGSLANLDHVVAKYINADEVSAAKDAYRVVPTKHGYRLVRVQTFNAKTPVDRYAVQVEAATGKVFEVRGSKFMLDGSAAAQVYPRYYKDDLIAAPFKELNLSFDGGSVTTDESGRFAGAPATAQPKMDGLVGTHVSVTPSTGTKIGASGVAARDGWDVIWQKTDTATGAEDKNLAQTMVYYHVNKEIARVKQYISVPWLDKQLTANVNLDQTCNAFWDGTSLNLFSAGDDCANTGNIADVMYHEWGHGLDDNTGGIEDGGYSEGFGDIMALAMTHSNILGIGFKVSDNSPVRDMSELKVYPADAGGEVHDEGLIIGGTFWDLFNGLKTQYGEDKASDMLLNYAVKTIQTASHYTDVYNAIQVVDDDNGDLSDGTPNYCILNKAFARHGLATADLACDLASLDAFKIDDHIGGNGNGVLEPGETATISVTARNAASTDVQALAGILTVDGTAVAVTNGNLNWSVVPSHGSASSDDTATIHVASDAACGAAVNAKVNLTSGARSAVAEQLLTIGTLNGTADLLKATGLPQPISDNTTTTTTLDVSGSQWDATMTVYSAHLKFDVRHSYVGDLTARLIGPDGTSKDVWKGSGAGHDEHFDADVTTALKGIKGLGQWKFTISDDAAQDEGNLDAVELTLTPAHFVCAP